MPRLTPQTYEKNRRRILKAAERCFLEQGFHKATLRQVAERAELSLGNLYHYFENREALVAELVQRDNREINEALEQLADARRPVEGLRKLFAAYIRELNDPAVAALYLEIHAEALRDPAVMAILQAQRPDPEERLSALLERLQEQGKIQLPAGATATARTLFALADHLALGLPSDSARSIKEALGEFEQMLKLLVVEGE